MEQNTGKEEGSVEAGFERIFCDLFDQSLATDSFEAAQRINETTLRAIQKQASESGDEGANIEGSRLIANPGGITWELWDQLCRAATHARDSSKLVAVLEALQTLPKWSAIQKSDGLNKTYEIEFWSDLGSMGHRPLSEWIFEFSYATFQPRLLHSPEPGSRIREEWRNYNAFAAQVAASNIALGMDRSGAGYRFFQQTITLALEPEKSQVDSAQVDVFDPEVRTGVVPAAAEWMNHGAKMIWVIVENGGLSKEKFNRKMVVQPHLSVSGMKRWALWKEQFAAIAIDGRYDEETRLCARSAMEAMCAADKTEA